jgi:2-polyprenyl-3-methyl-5-hydroxy-6-metoxy-1,4-benzoquinol methylase
VGITVPFPSQAELEKLYASNNYRMDDARRFIPVVESAIRRFRKARFGRISRYVKGSGRRILDVGCARGLMLSMARESGWEPYGLEFSAETARHAREELGLDVRACSIVEAGYEPGFFDIITIWHVLEHIESPAETIEECSKVLSPEGVLVVSVPNFDSLQARISGPKWYHLDLPYHLFHFSLANLRELLEKNSFRVIRVKHFSLEFGPFGFLQSLMSMTGIQRNLLYDFFKTGGLNKNTSRERGSASEFLMCAALLPVLGPLSFILSVFEAAIGRGGSIEIYAKKKST